MDAKNQLALVERNLSDEQLKEKATMLIRSKFLPSAIQTVEQAMAIIMTGRELGLGLMESLRSINVIQGKPAMSAQLMLALCQRTGELENMVIEEKNGFCVTTITRKGKSPYAYSFSMDDAKALGLDRKDNWIKQPKTMLRWRSLSGNLRVTFADAICGLYTDDEAEDAQAHVVAAEEVRQDAAAQKTEELTLHKDLDHENIHHEQVDLEIIDKIGASFIQDPAFYKAYPDKTVAEIFADKLPSGDPRGKKFLERVVEKSKNAQDRANIAKFLEGMAAQEPGK